MLVSRLGFFSSEPWTCSKSLSSSNIEANGVDDGKGLVGSTLPASEAPGDFFAALGLALEALGAWSGLVLTDDGDCEDGAEDGVGLRAAELREDAADAVSLSEEDACPTLTLFIYADCAAATVVARLALAALI